MKALIFFLLSLISAVSSNAAPTVVGNLPGNKKQVNPWSATLASLRGIVPTASPTSIPQASRILSSIVNSKPTDAPIYETIADLVAAGLTTDNVEDALNFVQGLLSEEDSDRNNNPRTPHPAAYPKASPHDAPYSVAEDDLRSAIYIPPSFKYGKGPQPVILVPGTGNNGYTTFAGNYIPLLKGSDIGDPVWINIPGFELNDAQVNSEYVAYAINYIYGISNQRKVAVFGWSQGNINTQWAFKYWPSTRSKVTDHVAFSPDYHGTVIANFAAAPHIPLPPSLLQQEYTSNYIATLRSDGGDSAYVPTTTVYSGFFDEIVEPQQGIAASAFLLDARNVGVSNNEVQLVCKGEAAGTFYTHEGTLYNPLGFALAMDALKHDGPGRASRLDLNKVCGTYLTPGLDLSDFLLTENTILVAGLQIVLYPDKTDVEPIIKCT